MADNVAITAGSGTTIAADDIGVGVLAQRVKPVWGPDGTGNDIDVATGKPLPVQVRSSTGLIPVGEPTDAKSTATDTTSASLISVAKQISASAQLSATAAKQPALGTAGTASSDVITIQGIASGTVVPISVATIPSHAVTNAGTFAVQATLAAGSAAIAKAEDVASADADVGVPAMAVRKATPANTSGTDGDYEFLQMSAGRVWTNSLLGDGTNAVAVKAASTAPVATDPALVVAISPNSVNANGRATPANSAPVVVAGEAYETVAASQTAQVMGGSGATGDYISGLLVIPATTSPGLVTLLDNATSIPVFVGGASSVSNLVPFFIPLGMRSASGAWKITTGSNVSVIGIGSFT